MKSKRERGVTPLNNHQGKSKTHAEHIQDAPVLSHLLPLLLIAGGV